MGANGYALSYLALNDRVIRGHRLSGHLPKIGDSQVIYLDFLGCNRWHAVPEVKDPDSRS
jgi:hypothetical protein